MATWFTFSKVGFRFPAMPAAAGVLLALGVAACGRAEVPANAKTGVQYVGSEKCIECHREEHRSYLDTTHSVAAEPTNAENEPKPSSFRHQYSGHTYEAAVRNGELLHREIIYRGNGQRRSLTEYPIVFSIGSGAHGKSYLFRDGNYWTQSPISWFTGSQDWGMSPGYDRPLHVSFRRKVSSGCVFCHVGNIDRKQGNPFDFDILETTIGCERCHGPGQLHVQKYRDQPEATAANDSSQPDDTIVNPANLTRELSEAVCQQCHLQAAAKVEVAGKNEWDFRPGLPLTDFRIDYQYRLGDDSMKIVGHVEQMHMSGCYQQTESLTCVSCHNPHDVVKAEDRVDHYRSICLDCHEDQSCGKPHEQRMRLADNSCYQCHMPKADTNVVHAAFHHHRIGIHDPEDKEAREVIAGLTPVLDVAYLDKQEQARGAAIAKYEVLRTGAGRPEFADYGVEAAGELIQLKQKGKEDPKLNAVLSWLARDQGQREIANMLAGEVLKQEPRPTQNRIDATRLLAKDAFKKGDHAKAAQLYRQLASYHRDAQDTYFLGLCENNTGNVEAGIVALKRSLEIDPSQEAAHFALQAIYQALRKQAESEYHGREAIENRQLNELLQQKAMEMMKKEKGE